MLLLSSDANQYFQCLEVPLHCPRELGWQSYWGKNSGILRTQKAVREQKGERQFQVQCVCHKVCEKFDKRVEILSVASSLAPYRLWYSGR